MIASGAGVVAEKTKIAGHAEITGIRAGVTEDRDPKKTVTAAEAGPPAVILDHVWVGAGIHIHTGGPADAREPFLPWRELPDDPDAVFALLSWRARLAPLVGRKKDKETLLRWARQGRNARIRLLSGPGGVGKSRLAAEVADALRADGWTAGFIRPNDPIVVPLRQAGLFLVVDYPEEHPNEVRTLLREVASRELRDVPVRLLVLSRQGGDRWFDLVESAHAGELMDAQEVGWSGLAAHPSFKPSRTASGLGSTMPDARLGLGREAPRGLSRLLRCRDHSMQPHCADWLTRRSRSVYLRLTV